MRKDTVVFELTDGEIRAFWFELPSFSRKLVHRSTAVKFDRIPIPTGLIEQGNVRNEDALMNVLVTYASQYPGKHRKAYLAIPLQQGFIQAYTVPWLPKRDRKSAISLLVDEEISITRSDLLYDFLVISEEKHKHLQILLGATRQSALERYVLIFGQAGFKVTGVDFAFSVLGQAFGFEPKEDVLYLQGESNCCQMALFRGTVPESVRTLHPLKRALPDTEDSEGRERERSEEWGNEIRRFILYYKTQQPDLDLKRLIWSGDLVTDQLAQGLLATNHVSEVEQAEIRGVPDTWRKVLAENKGLSEVAVGYALRIAAHRPELNLWCQPTTTLKVKRTYIGLACFTFALLMIVTIIWFTISQITLPLQQEVEELSRQGARIESQVKHQNDLQIAWNRAKIHPEKIGEGLAQVQALSGTGLNIKQVIYKQGSMSLIGSADDASKVQALIRSLRSMGWVQPALSSYKLTSQNDVEFSLSAKSGRIGTDPLKLIENTPGITPGKPPVNTGASLNGEGT
ncbi:MAG TPA: pilus assembly protein PilM [Desulfosporosinus sp.]